MRYADKLQLLHGTISKDRFRKRDRKAGIAQIFILEIVHHRLAIDSVIAAENLITRLDIEGTQSFTVHGVTRPATELI